MAKLKNMLMVVFLLFVYESDAQYYKVLMHIYSGEPAPSFLNSYKHAYINYNQYALENNGITYIVQKNNGNGDSVIYADLYDGKTLNCKYKIKRNYTYNNIVCRTKEFIGFYDVDGDNVREAVLQAYTNIDSRKFDQGFAFVDIQADRCEYYFDIENLSYAFNDIDNDSYPELITLHAILGHSKTPQPVHPPILPKSPVPAASSLSPNPFRTLSRIDYYVPLAASVKLRVFDASGRLCKTLVDANKPAGDYTVTWGGEAEGGGRLSAGQYYYTIQIGEFVSNKKVVVLDR